MRILAYVIIALGVVAFAIPFVGPLFNFGMGPDPAFAVTENRVLRHVLPGAAVIIGGVLMLARSAPGRWAGALLALAAGAWIGVGPFLLQVEDIAQLARRLVYHAGTGVALVVVASFALGRLSAQAAEEEREQAVAPRPAEQVR